MFPIHKMVLSFKVLVVLFTLILFTKSLFAYEKSYINLSKIPSNNDVINVLKDVYKDKYRDNFELKDFIRLNGYEKEYLYLINYNLTLIAKKDINLSQNYTDIAYFSRLVKLKNLNVLSNITEGENFYLKNEVIKLIKSEKGWIKAD
jgi:Tfp pilus assembly protein PilO